LIHSFLEQDEIVSRGGACIKNISVSMIILAAGLSERMRAFKPLLPIEGQPAVLRCISAAEQAGVREIIVVTGHRRQELEQVLLDKAPEARVVCNPRYLDGMYTSVCAGVEALSKGVDGFFLLPVDCCAVQPEVLTLLEKKFTEAEKGAVARPGFNGRRGHPPLIPILYKDMLLSYGGENGLKGFLAALPSIEVETNSPAVLLDMDTPEDLEVLLEFFRRG